MDLYLKIYGIVMLLVGLYTFMVVSLNRRHFRKFNPKELMKDGKFVSIAVMKAGQTAQGQDQVDALSGGTITSKGVESMLYNSIAPYEPFLKKAAGITK